MVSAYRRRATNSGHSQSASKRFATAHRALAASFGSMVGSLFASIVAAIAMSAGPVHAATPDIAIVFDGSGSMWGKLRGSAQAKFEIAQDALTRATAAHGKHARYGLVTFGQQSRGGCTAASIVVPPGSSAVAALEPLGSFNPKGRGPLTLGLRTAASALKTAKGPRRIILIHDDPDNCQEDICAAVQALKKDMPDLQVHAVSLGTKPQHEGALACVAAATGGSVAETADADEAVAAITAAIRKAAAGGHNGALAAPHGVVPIKPPPPAPALAPTPGLALAVVLAPGKPPLREGVVWRIGAADAKALRTVVAAQPSIALLPGAYKVEAEVGGHVVRKSVTVADGPRTRTVLSLDGGRLRFVAAAQGRQSAATASPQAPTLEVRPLETSDASRPVWLGRLGAGSIVLPAGRYRAIVQAGAVRRETDLTVAAGEDRTVEVPLDSGELVLSVSPTSGTGITFTIEADDATAPSGRRVIARSAAPSPRFVLPAGTYYVTAAGDAGMARDSVVITTGAVLERKLTLAAVTLKVLPRLKGRRDAPGSATEHTVWRLDGATRPIASSTAMDPVFRLPPGRYRIRSQIGHQNAAVVRDFEVGAVVAGELRLEHDAGTLRASLSPRAATGEVYWRVIDSSGRTVWRTDGTNVDAVLMAGTYAIVADAGPASFRATAVVAIGQHIALELGPR